MKKNVSLIVEGSKEIGYSIFKSFISSGQDIYNLSRKIKKSWEDKIKLPESWIIYLYFLYFILIQVIDLDYW